MIKFKKLFSFSSEEIKLSFKHCKIQAKHPGLKLLQCSMSTINKTLNLNIDHGKLLIITPKKSGKAHKRNLIRRQAKAIFYEQKLFEHQKLSVLLVYANGIDIEFNALKGFLKANIT